MIEKIILDLFKKKKIVTIDELSASIDRSHITARRVISQMDYLTSYNANSHFYTLRSLAKFDKNNIWKSSGAYFTSFNTLDKLLLNLIGKSRSGFSVNELEEIVSVSVTPVLLALFKKGKLVRVRQGKEYIYLTSHNKRETQKQSKNRFGSKFLGLDRDQSIGKVKELEDIILVLLEIIRIKPGSLGELRKSLQKTNSTMAGQASLICQKYGIKLKKKINLKWVFGLVVQVAREVQKISGTQPIITFYPEQEFCNICSGRLVYYKTSPTRTIQTLQFGEIRFQEIKRYCPDHEFDESMGHSVHYGSSFLKLLVAPNFHVGFDVIAKIGMMRFIEFRQVKEIIRTLKEKGISLKPSSIGRYTDWFLAGIECLHNCRIKKLKILIKENGGYLLHIDATCENKSDTVFICLDKITGVVLLSERIPTENKEDVKTHLQELKRNFGSPMSIMRDMSSSMGNPAKEIFPNASDRICTFHFLKDVGKDLLGELNVELGKHFTSLKINPELNKLKRDLEKYLNIDALQNSSGKIEDYKKFNDRFFVKMEGWIAYCLIFWVLKYKEDGNGLGFPFERHRLYYFNRVKSCYAKIIKISDDRERVIEHCDHLMRLKTIVSKVKDAELCQLARSMKVIGVQFDRLRKVLKFTVDKKSPLTKTIGVSTLKEVREYNRGLKKYTKELVRGEKKNTLSESEVIILKHVMKYHRELPVPEDLIELYSEYFEQTNNDTEGLFWECKRGPRRVTGKKDISREFNLYGPYLPLTKNLTNENYIKTVIGETEELCDRFSELEIEDVKYYQQKLKENRNGKMVSVLPLLRQLEVIPL
jgi:hypothetical protein